MSMLSFCLGFALVLAAAWLLPQPRYRRSAARMLAKMTTPRRAADAKAAKAAHGGDNKHGL